MGGGVDWNPMHTSLGSSIGGSAGQALNSYNQVMNPKNAVNTITNGGNPFQDVSMAHPLGTSSAGAIGLGNIGFGDLGHIGGTTNNMKTFMGTIGGGGGASAMNGGLGNMSQGTARDIMLGIGATAGGILGGGAGAAAGAGLVNYASPTPGPATALDTVDTSTPGPTTPPTIPPPFTQQAQGGSGMGNENQDSLKQSMLSAMKSNYGNTFQGKGGK